MKKILSAILATVMVLSLAACSGKPIEKTEDNKQEDNSQTTTAESSKIPKRTSYFQFADERVYFLTYGNDSYIGSVNLDGEDLRKANISKNGDNDFVDCFVSPDKTIWVISSPIQSKPTQSEIINYDTSGNEIARFTVDGGPMYIRTDEEKNIYLVYDDEKEHKIAVLNPTGEKLFELPTGNYPSIIVTGDNKLLAVYYENEEPVIKTIDVMNKCFKDSSIEVNKDNGCGRSFKGDEKYSFYINVGDKLIGFNKDTHKVDDVIDFGKYDIELDDIASICPAGNGRFVIVLFTETSYEFKVIKL